MPRPTTHAKRVHLYMPPEQLDRLQKVAAGAGLSKSEVMRRAVTHFFAVLDRKLKARAGSSSS